MVVCAKTQELSLHLPTEGCLLFLVVKYLQKEDLSLHLFLFQEMIYLFITLDKY